MQNHFTASPTPGTSRRDAKAQPWILLVDDDALVRRLVDTVLGDRGWKVRMADGADAALALVNAATVPPAVLICDIIMPKTDGLELTRQILARIPNLSVILISGHLPGSNWWPTDLNRVRVLTKPFLNQELINAVTAAMEVQAAIA